MFLSKREIITKIMNSLFSDFYLLFEDEKSIKSELEGNLKRSYNRIKIFILSL